MSISPPKYSPLPPIPFWEERPGWGGIPIVECGEPLVALHAGAATNLLTRSLYAEAGIPGASHTILLRSGVAERLLDAAERLRGEGVMLAVFDGFRPLCVQQHLFDQFLADVRRQQPDLTDDEALTCVRRFVAAPSADPACPPPHRSGGAADVYLVDAATGTPLPMGTEPDEIADASETRHFEIHQTEPFTTHRRRLFHAMTDAGFANYYGEWWHYDWGNQRWANVTGTPAAIYGIASEPQAPLPSTSGGF